MTKRILYNFASRSRPSRFWATISNIMEMTADMTNAEFCVKIDPDDPKLKRYYDFTLNNAKGIVYCNQSTSKVHAINRDIPQDGWDILVNISDDIRFTINGFDSLIREHCGPDDFVLYPEPYASKQMNSGKNGLISVVSIMGIDYYKRDGYVYHPSYKRTHCDNEATEVAKIRQRFKQMNISLFYHEHPAAGYKEVADDLYKLEKLTWGEDAANYKRRKEAGFPA